MSRLRERLPQSRFRLDFFQKAAPLIGVLAEFIALDRPLARPRKSFQFRRQREQEVAVHDHRVNVPALFTGIYGAGEVNIEVVALRGRNPRFKKQRFIVAVHGLTRGGGKRAPGRFDLSGLARGRKTSQELIEEGTKRIDVNGRFHEANVYKDEECRRTCPLFHASECVLMSFLTQARPTLALALPIMAGQLSQMGIGLVDSAMVGHVSTLALAAAAFAINVANIPTVFGIGAMSGLSVRVAQAQGAGDDERTAELLRHGLWLSLALGIAISLLMLAFIPLLGHLGQNPAVVREATPFFSLVSLSVAPVIVGMAAKSFGDAMQNPWPPTLLFLASIPLTGFLNWVFVYGNLGAPAMGLTGSGVATLLARVVAMVALLVWLFKSARFSPVRPARWRGRLDAQEARALASVGIPTAFQVAVEVGAFAIGALIVGMLGEVPFAAHQIAITCAGTMFMLPLGIAIATTVRIGNAIGARELHTVRAIGFSSAVIGTLFMILSGLTFWLFGRHIAAVFVKDPAVIDLAAKLLIVASIFQLCDGVQATMAGALRGLSDAVVPMVVCMVGYWVLAIPFGYYLAFKAGMGARGMWWGFALGLAIVAVSLSWRFYLRTRGQDLEEIAAHLPAQPILAH